MSTQDTGRQLWGNSGIVSLKQFRDNEAWIQLGQESPFMNKKGLRKADLLAYALCVLLYTLTCSCMYIIGFHYEHMLNMELDLQSLFRLHDTWCAQHSCTVLIGWDPTPQPPINPHLGSYTRALLVSQDWRHLLVTPWLRGTESSDGYSVESPWKWEQYFLYVHYRFSMLRLKIYTQRNRYLF